MLTGILLFTGQAFGQVTLSGKITDKQQGAPLQGANIVLENTAASAVADEQGNFTISHLKSGLYRISVSFVGFKTVRQEVHLIRDTTLLFGLTGAPLLGEEVNIIATRAHDRYPTAYRSVTGRELKNINLGKDVPFLIEGTPSTVVTSDAGNGVGYTGISIRGTDLTRINVTINSIPLNEAESQGVWFVDLPDIASSAADIQVQRGVGTSTNGAGAFGASINIMTSDLHQDPYGELDVSGGSYNTLKSTLRFGTGLMSSKFSVDGRLSYIRSDGYMDRASSNLKSYYLSGGFYGSRTTLKFITFSGLEKTYQSWEGVPKDSLATNRTYNPSGEYHDKDGNLRYYNNQTDNYQQDHYQLIFSQMLTAKWNINAALHYTKGRGYYENYKEHASLADYGLGNVVIGNDTVTQTNLVNRKMMDNDFMGMTFSTNYSIPDKLKVTLGGAWNKYDGRHFGKVIWAEYASNGDNDRNWYRNTGRKTDFNIFGKANWQISGKLSLFADLQYRRVTYKLDGILEDLLTLDQSHKFDFFNPKCGLYYAISKHHDLYFSFGVANREPSRNNYKDADPGKTPTNETLYDYELGYTYKNNWFRAGANLYYMNYKDQLVLTGEINSVGEAIMVNIPHSYRAGAELSAGVALFEKRLFWDVNATFSRNRIKHFTQYIDAYDADWNSLPQKAISLGETSLSFSPDIIVNSVISIRPAHSLTLSLNSKYVGRQYIDNSGSRERSLNDYFVNGMTAGYTLRGWIFREIGLNLTVNNIFNVKYETNAWVYPYYLGDRYYEDNGYFPQAMVNFLVGITVKL